MKLQDLVKLKPIIEALEKGKTIQCRMASGWFDLENNDAVFYDDPRFEYRIKPEPREWYVCIDRHGNIYGSRDEPNEYYNKKVREVIE